MRAGEVARRAGVNIETLRYYERRGLLPEPARTPSGHRRYDEDVVRFLRAIKDVQATGFTLAEIEEYLRAVQRGRVPASEAGLNGLLETLARLPTAEEVLALRPTTALQHRIEELLETKRNTGLSREEPREWEQYEYIEHLVRLAKARAFQLQAQQ